MSLSAKSFELLQRDIFLFLTNLITSIIVARKLGPEGLGIWVILQMIPFYAECFVRIKVDIAAVYYLGKDKYCIRDMKYFLNIVAIISSLIVILPIIWKFDWFYQILFGNSRIDASTYMYLILIQIPLHFLYMNYSYLFISKEDITTYNRMVVIRAVIFSLIILLCVVIMEINILALVIASLLSVFIAVLYGINKLKTAGKRTILFNYSLIRDCLAYGFKVYLSGIVGHLNIYITRTILVYFLLPAQVAFFSMAQNQGELINKIPNSLNTILFSRLTKIADEDFSAALCARAFRVTLLISLVIGLIGFVSIKYIVLVLYGRAFLPMVVPFMIILPGVVLTSATSIINQYFNGINRADIVAKVGVVPLFLQITLALILIPRMGLVGASIAFLCALFFTSLVQLIVFAKISSCEVKTSFIINKDDFNTVLSFLKLKLNTISNKRSLRRFNN